MDFFNRVGGMLAETGAEISQKAKETSTVLSLKNRIHQEEEKLATLYRSIGEKYFNEHKNNTEDAFMDDLESIKAALAGIETLKQQINEAKGVRYCTSCGAEIKDGDAFCNKCGSKVE